MNPGLFVLLVLSASTHAHFSLWDKSMIVCNANIQPGNDVLGWASHPLLEKHKDFNTWWMHGFSKCQDKAETVMALPAGGQVEIAMARYVHNVPKEFSPGGTGKGWDPPNPDKVLTAAEWLVPTKDVNVGNQLNGPHNIHVEDRKATTGCALAIAYKSNAKLVNPKDFVVFSVVKDCPKRQREYFKVPQDMPACPNDLCICSWFRIPRHGLKNYYMTPFQCKVTGAKSTKPVDIQWAVPPRRCLDPATCNFGPRNPFYWLVGNPSDQVINMPEPLQHKGNNPMYTNLYGFREGAQDDIFTHKNPWRLPKSPTPAAQKCSKSSSLSRLTSEVTKVELKSPACTCTATYQDGWLRVKEGSTTVYNTKLGYSKFGPQAIMNDPLKKAGKYYFPNAEGPYRIDLNDRCALVLKDGKGMTLWESPFDNNNFIRKNLQVSGMDADPAISHWRVKSRLRSSDDDDRDDATFLDGVAFSGPGFVSSAALIITIIFSCKF